MQSSLLGCAPQSHDIIVMGASIDWGGRYDIADHNTRDWPTIIIGQAPAPYNTPPLLYAPCTRLNIAVNSAQDWDLTNIPIKSNYSHTIAVFGAIWANNIGHDETAVDCYALLVSRVAQVVAMGITKIVIATGYLLVAETDPQRTQFSALNAMIIAGKGGYPGATIARLDINPPIDVTDLSLFPDGGHPSCPGSSVNPGNGMIILAQQFAPAINAHL